MNETLNTILTRRSTRKFSDKPIPEDEMELIVQAGLHAPSGMGLQTWQFTVVRNREKIQMLAAAVEKTLDRQGYDMYQPQVLVIPSNERRAASAGRTMRVPWKICSLPPIPLESVLCGLTSSRESAMSLPSAGF